MKLQYRLYLALQESDVTVDQLADELGVHRNTIGNYLAGRTRPRRSVLSVWADRTGVPLAWLEHGIDEGSTPPEPTSTQRRRASRWKLDAHDQVVELAAA